MPMMLESLRWALASVYLWMEQSKFTRWPGSSDFFSRSAPASSCSVLVGSITREPAPPVGTRHAECMRCGPSTATRSSPPSATSRAFEYTIDAVAVAFTIAMC